MKYKPHEEVEDLTPIQYRAIIECLLRHADLSEVEYRHRSVLERAYEACGIEVKEVRRFYRGHFPHDTVVPVDD